MPELLRQGLHGDHRDLRRALRAARRGAKPPVFPVAAVDDPELPEVLAELAAARADEMDADTVNRELVLDGFTLHRLRHSALTHDAEGGTSTPTLLARSRHASVRSLERYARPGVDAVARHVAERDPAARRRT